MGAVDTDRAGAESWGLGPFEAQEAVAVQAAPELRFRCPVSGHEVAWAGKDVFNPAAAVHRGRVHLLVRGEDHRPGTAGTSRLGLATSTDGLHFDLEPEPVLYPADDELQGWEWPGGCEDPRLVESPEGGFVCLYTAFDGRTARLAVATSPDLRHWDKRGLAFAGTGHASRWSKSGAVVTELVGDRLVAARRDGRYWMYWGEGVCFLATSTDLIRWKPLEFDPTPDRYLTRGDDDRGWSLHGVPGPAGLRPALFPRRGRFDSALVEPGPPAVATDAGVVLIYNGANHPDRGDPTLPAHAYHPGQALFDLADPTACVARARHPFLVAERADERQGQVDNVCFAQGLVRFGRRWHLYYGMADSRVGCALGPRSGP